jgi:hypothetical protein
MTTSPDLAFRPHQVDQLDGSRYAGLNCNCAAAAMALERDSLGKQRTTGAYVRALTGDTSGGTNLAQIQSALQRRWGMYLDVEYRLSFDSFTARIRNGQGAVLQGSCLATKGTMYQESESFAGNHSWFVNDIDDADEFLVYFPLGDARRDGITDSPRRVPKALVKRFAGLLDLDGNGNRLGSGLVYAGFTRDTEPHVHLRASARRTRPFPDRTRANETKVRVRREPGRGNPVIGYLDEGDLFTAYQHTDSWLGNHDGTRWVPKYAMRRIGGST